MDRLPALTAACLCALACDAGPSPEAEPAPKGRVEAVLSRADKKTWRDLCDVSPSTPAAFRWPALDGPAAATSDARYRWVNVWASWCKPCVEELPLLARALGSWRNEGDGVTLTLLSVDADADNARRFLAERPELPQSLRLQDPAAAPGWLAELGLRAGTSIPVHIVLDARDKLLCVRAGAIGPRDLEHFHRLLFR